MSFSNWQARLRGETVKTFLQPDALDEGYYRKPETEKLPNGRRKVLGYTPVAYFMDGNRLAGIIGGRDMTDDEVGSEELWSWVVSNPIPYDWYQAVAERGEEWPDKEKWTSVVPPVGAAEESGAPADADKRKKPRDQELEEAIIKEIAAAPKKIASDDDIAVATGSKNKLAELRLAAKRDGEAEYKPLYAKYKALQERWAAVMGLADTEERRIAKAILTLREEQRQAAAKAAAAAAEEARQKAQAEFEANERVADRAIARGEPAPEPQLTLQAPPAAAPAPAPVVPTYGKRVVKEEVKKFAVIQDWVAVFTHFQADPELQARLEKLATEAIRAGTAVPGATSREGLI